MISTLEHLYWCLSLFWGGHATDSLYFGWNSVWWSSVPREKFQQPLSSFTPPPTSLMLFPELDSLPPVSVKGSVLSLMEYGLIWKMCLQTCLQMDYISHMHWPGKTCSLRGHHYLEGVLYFKMEKGSWATTCIHCLCFLILDVIRVANSNSCCLQIHAMMNYFWNCESEKNVFSIKSLLLVCFFNHINRKRNQNNLFLEKDKIRHPEESVYLSLYPSRRKKKIDIPGGTELPRIYQWWTSKLAVN